MNITQEDKDLLLRYLSMAILYNVKILHNDWDYDRDCDFSSVETLIGIDDRFIYTLKGGKKDEHSIIEPLSVLDYKPYLRPLSSITDEEMDAYTNTGSFLHANGIPYNLFYTTKGLIFLLNNHFDIFGLIPKGLAIAITEENNPYNITED